MRPGAFHDQIMAKRAPPTRLPNWPGLMTAKQACEYLNVDRGTLDRLRFAGYIMATRAGRTRNAKLLYTRESLAAFIESPPDTIDCEAIMAAAVQRRAT